MVHTVLACGVDRTDACTGYQLGFGFNGLHAFTAGMRAQTLNVHGTQFAAGTKISQAAESTTD